MVGENYTKLGQLDYAAELAEIRAAKPQAVYIFLPGGMGINFIKQYVGAGLGKDTTLLLPGFSADQDVINPVGAAMAGLFNTAHWSPDFTNPRTSSSCRVPEESRASRLCTHRRATTRHS